MKKIIKLVLIIAALAGMTGMVSCANGSSDDSSSEISATKEKKTTTVKIGDTEYVYTTTDDKVDTSDKVTVADDGSVTVKADDGSKITISKDGKTITYTDKNGKEYTGAFAEETTLKSSDGSEVKATTKSKTDDSLNVELPASVGVNELAGKSKTQSDLGYKETFSFDESYYTYTKDTTVGGGGAVEKSIYRYSYDSTKKLVYLVKIKGIHNDKIWTNAAGYKSKIKFTTNFQVERERVEFSTVQAYKYSFDSNPNGFLTHYFTGSMPTLASFVNDDLSLWGCRLSKNNTYLQTLTFTDGTSGTFKGETGITGTYSVEGNAKIYNTDSYPLSIENWGISRKSKYVSGELIYEVTETKKTENENGEEIKYSVYTNKAGNTVVTKYFDSSDERSYKVTCTDGEYTVKYDESTKKLTVIHSDGTTKTFENIKNVYLSEDFSSYMIIDYLSDGYTSKTSHVYSGKDGTEKETLEKYRINLTFTSVPAGISLTANKTYTLYLSEN
jgi:hypothetical protein